MFSKFAPKFAIAAAALCTVGLFSAPAAFAAANKTVEVHYKDLDLATIAGQDALQGRLKAAARNVCRTNHGTTGTIIQSSIDTKCYKKALADVRDHVATAIDKADDTRLGG